VATVMTIDSMRDIRDSMITEIAAELGVTYTTLPYLEDVEKNNFRSNDNRYGVRALISSEVAGVTKSVHFTQSFEVVLTKGYQQSKIDDSEKVEKAYDNRENILCIYKRLVNTRAGIPGTVLNIQNLVVSEPEYLVDEKVAVQRATMDITYRFSLI
jgi:hypothetical protein